MSLAKIIAVCGSSGCGKSLVSLALAHNINERKKSAVVISCDRTTPMFSTFLPFNRYEDKNSLGALLNNAIDKQALKNRLHCSNKINDTAVLSFGVGENVQKYPLIQNYKLDELFALLSEYTDYIICDLASNFILEKSSMFALQCCDFSIKLLSPDNSGLSFSDTYTPLLQGYFNEQQHITALSNVFEYSPYKTIMKERDIEYFLPHSKALYLSFLAGEQLSKADDESALLFNSTLNTMLERLVLND